MQSLAQQLSLPCASEDVCDSTGQIRQLTARVAGIDEIHVLLGEVERCFDQHPQPDHRFDQCFDALRKFAGEAAQRRPRRRPGVGFDQIGDRLRLRQIEPIVEERAAGAAIA